MRHPVSSDLVEEGGLCGFLFGPLFLDVAQYGGDERSVGLREHEQHLTIGAERDAWRAGHGLAQVVHGLAMA